MAARSDKDIAAIIERPELITAAINRGVREAMVRHVQADLPMSEWRDGKCVSVPPDEIQKRIEKMDSDPKS